MGRNKKFTVVSLFCGAGGMDMGFDLEGFADTAKDFIAFGHTNSLRLRLIAGYATNP